MVAVRRALLPPGVLPTSALPPHPMLPSMSMSMSMSLALALALALAQELGVRSVELMPKPLVIRSIQPMLRSAQCLRPPRTAHPSLWRSLVLRCCSLCWLVAHQAQCRPRHSRLRGRLPPGRRP